MAADERPVFAKPQERGEGLMLLKTSVGALKALCGAICAVILMVVPVSSSSGQSLNPSFPAPVAGAQNAANVPPAIRQGVAIGDCGDNAVAIARRSSGQSSPPEAAQKACEGGRIMIAVQPARAFGYRIMDPMRVTVMLALDPSVTLDLQSLARGTIAFTGQEFDLVSALALDGTASPVDVAQRRLRDGRTLVKIDLILQSSVPASAAPYLVFRLDLRYALGNIRNNQGVQTDVPDWRVLSTPLIAVTMSATAAPGAQLILPEAEPVDALRPWPTMALLVVGIFASLFWPGLIAVRWLNRNRPGRRVTAEEKAWAMLSSVIADGSANGYSVRHVQRIASAVRRYLGKSAATREEMRVMLKGHPREREIERLMNRCDAVLYRGAPVSPELVSEMMADLEAVVPKPRR